MRERTVKRYSKREKQALAMARALVPGLLPAIAAYHALEKAEAPGEASVVRDQIWELFCAEQAAGRLPKDPVPSCNGDDAWIPVRSASAIVLDAVEIAREMHKCTQRDPEALWQHAHLRTTAGQAGGGALKFPPPLTLAEVRAMLAFDWAALTFLASSPSAPVRTWAATHAHLVEVSPRFERLYEKMQLSDVQEATDRALSADPKEFGADTVRGITRKRSK